MKLARALAKIRRLLTGEVKLPPQIVLGRRVHLGRGVSLDQGHGHLITIEDDATLAEGARILTHDATSYRRTGLTWVAPVRICRRAFVGAEAIILPGVMVGPDAIVAAGSVVTHDVPPGVIVAGVPARPIGTSADLDIRRAASRRPVFDRAVYNVWPLPEALLDELDDAADGGGYFFGPQSQSADAEDQRDV